MYAAQSKNRIKNDRVQLYCVLYLVVWLLAPPLAYGTIYRLLAIVAAFVWLVLQLFNEVKFKKSEHRLREINVYIFSMLIYIFAILLLEYFVKSISPFSVLADNLTTYILLFVGYVAYVYGAEKRASDLKVILYLIIALAVIFSLTSVFRSNEFYEYTRMAGGSTDKSEYILAQKASAQGVGSFGFFCFTSILAPITLWLFFDLKRRWLLISFFIIEIGVISAGYTLALMISLIGAIVAFVIKSRSAFLKVLMVLLAIGIIVFWDIIADLLYSFLYRITEGSFYHKKVIDIFAFLLEGESGDTFDARAIRYMHSLRSIFNYPFFGSLFLSGIRSSGYHSSIMDTFAVYGWPVGMIWFYLTVIAPYRIGRLTSKKTLLPAFISALLCITIIFNRHVMPLAVFYFLTPACNAIVLRIKKEANNENFMDNKCAVGKRRRTYRKCGIAKRYMD